MNAIDRPIVSASAHDWAVFLKPLLAAMNQQPSREQFNSRCAAIAFAMPEVPRSMLVPWRQRDAMRTFKFLPSPQEIAEWLGPDLRAERETQSRRAGLALPAPSAAENRDPVEIAQVLAKAKAFASEMDSRRQPDGEMAPVRPMPLSDGALLTEYERMAAEGNGMAAVRAKTLRERLGIEA